MVATVFDLPSSAVAVSYYERDGYYAKNDPEHRQASFWHGDAAKALGLRAHVHPSRFEEVLSGCVPGTEIRLGRMREGEHDHRPGWDLTFSAPKSVSLEALVIGDRRVIRAHDEAVRATLDWVEAELLETRGWDPATRRRPRVKADGMVVAGFRHLTSRNQDPQLHTHCVLANMTRTASGDWRSVEPTRIRRSAKLIGAYYRNELARRLQALGMAVTPTLVGRIPGFELAGYDRSFLEVFSGRRREILAHLEKRGVPYTPQAAQRAALHTRRRKQDRSLADLVPEWREWARALGLSREKGALTPSRPVDPLTGERVSPPIIPPPDLPANEIRSLKRAPALPRLPRDAVASGATRARPARSPAPAELSPEPELGVLEAVGRAVAHVAERRTAIPETEIRAVALGHAPGRYTLAEVDAAIARLVRSGELIEAERRGMDRGFVTDRAVLTERRVVVSMRAGRGKGEALAVEEAVEARLGVSRLTRGQREAVRTVLLSKDLVIGVQGHAGSGKTTMLREVKELLGGRRIQGLAPSAAAARVLAREAGIGSRTLQYFLTRFDDLSDADRLARGRAEYAGAVLAVDEASMIDTGRMEALLRIADRLGVARVALVGDTAQLRAVDAGQPFRLLQKAGMATATMDQVLRQRDPELLRSVMQAREGAPRVAIEGLGDRVREAPREELGIEAGRRWLALPREHRADTLILAPTHAIRRQANETVREGLEEEGILHGRVLAVDRLVNRRLTRTQASDLRSYEPGDLAVFHRDVFGCRANDVCMVVGHEDGKVVLAHPDGERRFRPSGNAATYLGLYDTERIELRAGERIRWTRNRKAPRPRFGHPPAPDLVNGGEAEILEIGRRRVRFRDGDGREFGLALDDPQLRHLDHAYCSTVHAAQGRTARAAIAVLDAGGTADRELFHVEISRVKEAFLLLTDDREALIELLESRDGNEDGALEALGIDPAAIPAVDPEVFAELAEDWRALRQFGEETNAILFFLPGYREVMARAAALSEIEDLPADMRRFVDGMLAEHTEHLARDREVRGLVERIQEHWRRWPELGWVASAQACAVEKLPRYEAWREEGAALLEAGRQRLAEDGEAARHLRAMPGVGLEGAVETLERTRLLDDARRFERDWRELRERAARDGIPELLAEGYGQVAELGDRLAAAEGLDARPRETVAEWRAVDAAQTVLADEVRTLPGRVAAWRERRADLPLDERGGFDPAHPARLAWREEGVKLEAGAEDMLRPENAHAPYLDGMPGARGDIRRAADEVRDSLRHDRCVAFGGLTLEVVRQARETRTEAFHVPCYGDTIEQADALSRQAGLPARTQELVASWLDYHARCEVLCQQIRDWPGRVETVLADCPEPPARLDTLRSWRQRSEPLLAEAAAMQATGSAHAPHLRAMPEERKALVDGTSRLDRALLAVEAREMSLLATVAQRSAEQTGGIAFDASGYAEMMERVRSLDARSDLPDDLREENRRLFDRDERWTRERERVGAFLERAAQIGNAPSVPAETAAMASRQADRSPAWDGGRTEGQQVLDEAKALRDDIPQRELAAHLGAAGAGPDEIEETEREIRERIAEQERARAAAAEAERQEQEGARIAGESARAAELARDALNEEDERREREARTRQERGTHPVHDASQGLLSDWNAHADAARQEGIHPFHASGYGELVERIRSHAREAVANLPAPLASVLQDHDPLVRAEREANKLAGRLDACMERRDKLLERAERKLPYNRPVVDLGRAYARWQRGSGGAIEAGRELLGNERYGPHLDALGGRAKIEHAVARLEKAAVLDRLPARIVSGWEKLDERVRETGRDRFFLPEHERVCELMSRAHHDIKDGRAWRFVADELGMREEMSSQAESLDTLKSQLQEHVREREHAQAQDQPFVRQKRYEGRRYWAELTVEEAKTVLAEGRKYAPHFNENPNLRETLKTLSGALDRSLRSESPEWELIKSERQRIEMERQQSQDKSQDRGMSM